MGVEFNYCIVILTNEYFETLNIQYAINNVQLIVLKLIIERWVVDC